MKEHVKQIGGKRPLCKQCGLTSAVALGFCQKCYQADYQKRIKENGGHIVGPRDPAKKTLPYTLRFQADLIKRIEAQGGREWAQKLVEDAIK